jgi:hypothetical protein
MSDLKKNESSQDIVIYDAAGLTDKEIYTILEGPEGGHAEYIDGKLIIRTEGANKSAAAEWIHLVYGSFFGNHDWRFYRSASITGRAPFGEKSSPMPDITAYPSALRPRGFIGDHSGQLQPLPHFVCEVEWQHLVDHERMGIPKVQWLFSLTGRNDTVIHEGWVLSVPQVDDPDAVPENVVGLPVDMQPVVLGQLNRPDPGVCWLAILTREGPVAGGVREYFPLLPNTGFVAPAYSIWGGGMAGAPPAPSLMVNRLLEDMDRISLQQPATPV